MKNKKTINLLIYSFLFVVLVSCKSTPKTIKEDGGVVIKSGDGWKGDNTYRMTTVGSWSREKYYIEGVEDADSSKQPKSIFILRQLSKTAAKTMAIRNFKQTMISETTSETIVKDNTVLKDEIVNNLQGISIAPIAIEEVYSPRGDAEVTYEFRAEGLRKNVENAISDTVKRFRDKTASDE